MTSRAAACSYERLTAFTGGGIGQRNPPVDAGNDWVEPSSPCRPTCSNTGISTYVWLLNNRKTIRAARQS
jgi:hypothetical protein